MKYKKYFDGKKWLILLEQTILLASEEVINREY